MTIIESKTSIPKPVSEVYAFLSDFNNHKQLMPPDIYNWSSTAEEARFAIKNMANLALKISGRTENKEIKIVPLEEAPFKIELKWTLTDKGNGITEILYTISANLNMMMKMLATGPLQKLANYETEQLKGVLAS